MAPKCKSIPSWNPLHSRTSSSDSTPLHILFHDEKAHKDFLENFSNCGIHLECHVVLSDFSDTALPIVIHSRGCESLCKIPVRCPTMFIYEFYTNMHDIDTSIPQFATQIWGTHIVVTLEIIFETLYVSRVSHPIYHVCPLSRTIYKDELLSLFCETPSS